MSRADVELVRRVYNAARRDTATVLALYDTEVELDLSTVALGGLTGESIYHHGHDGLRDSFRAWHEAWEKDALSDLGLSENELEPIAP